MRSVIQQAVSPFCSLYGVQMDDRHLPKEGDFTAGRPTFTRATVYFAAAVYASIDFDRTLSSDTAIAGTPCAEQMIVMMAHTVPLLAIVLQSSQHTQQSQPSGLDRTHLAGSLSSRSHSAAINDMQATIVPSVDP